MQSILIFCFNFILPNNRELIEKCDVLGLLYDWRVCYVVGLLYEQECDQLEWIHYWCYFCLLPSALAELELLVDRARDVTEFRIDAILKDMATTTLCQLPEDEPWTVQQFLDNTQVVFHFSQGWVVEGVDWIRWWNAENSDLWHSITKLHFCWFNFIYSIICYI